MAFSFHHDMIFLIWLFINTVEPQIHNKAALNILQRAVQPKFIFLPSRSS